MKQNVQGFFKGLRTRTIGRTYSHHDNCYGISVVATAAVRMTVEGWKSALVRPSSSVILRSTDYGSREGNFIPEAPVWELP